MTPRTVPQARTSSGADPAELAREAPRGLVILGHPVSQSLSPVFQHAALAARGLDVRYERLDVAPDPAQHALETVLAECRRTRTGGNVTMPHKEAVYARCHRRSATAERTGAVNTFWWEHEALVGHNTDVHGVAATIHALRPEGLRGPVVLLGAGGAAAAVLVALEQCGATGAGAIHVAARTPARAASMLARVNVPATVHGPDLPEALLHECTMLINATPAGMEASAPPLDVRRLSPRAAVFDLVYHARGTALVREARARGLVAEDGLRMLVEQGAAAFETWFGVPAPRDVMWAALGETVPPADRMRE